MSSKQNSFTVGTTKLLSIVVVNNPHVRGTISLTLLGRYGDKTAVDRSNIHFYRGYVLKWTQHLVLLCMY